MLRQGGVMLLSPPFERFYFSGSASLARVTPPLFREVTGFLSCCLNFLFFFFHPPADGEK